uniref:Uncharacterized protein n=1 Tax=Siphoviridae sp. ctZgu8 TaxID=2827893 RepID=A0A8S5SLW9_9CAUD|nr:MAG TPA: hypothetical protein [Siphoviridae sp. ctZgu8]
MWLGFRVSMLCFCVVSPLRHHVPDVELVSKNPAHVAGFSRIYALFLRGLPPPTPRPGR